jgi:hypothetical protein
MKEKGYRCAGGKEVGGELGRHGKQARERKIDDGAAAAAAAERKRRLLVYGILFKFQRHEEKTGN